jgi:hypothetical protein
MAGESRARKETIFRTIHLNYLTLSTRLKTMESIEKTTWWLYTSNIINDVNNDVNKNHSSKAPIPPFYKKGRREAYQNYFEAVREAIIMFGLLIRKKK